ncbi:hypothetical protein [Methanothrix sp.]|uniref:hypothetical protein n=1 Tax=Methanothrix sp. TaxID=90426 RepID=UPI0034E1AA87
MNKKTCIVALLLVCLSGISSGDTNEDITAYVYFMDHSIKGEGFFSQYHDMTSNTILVSKLAHGSGIYEEDMSYDSRNRATFYPKTNEYDTTSSERIKFSTSTGFAYSPFNLDLGKSLNITMQSKGLVKTAVKSYFCADGNNCSGLSAGSRLSSLDALGMDVSGDLYFTDTTSSDEDKITDNVKGHAKMTTSAKFNGRARIEVIDMNSDLYEDLRVDEEYAGRFSFTKSISRIFGYSYVGKTEEHWMPCCLLDGRLTATSEEIFSCSCTPGNASRV